MPDSQEPTPPSDAWTKLRRRKVVQWSLGYVALAWGVLQAVGFAVDTFGGSQSVTRVAAVLAAYGLAVVLTLAWYHGDQGHQRATRIELAALAVIAAAAAATSLYTVRGAGQSHVAKEPAGMANPGIARITDLHRLAILPFENLGNDPANAAFVGGVHDSLITLVAKVPGLSVISRSSVMQFDGKHPTIRDVAHALDVGAVLEGSVQRAGQRLRIQAQLIDARSDAHLWAETYDRDADDLFAVQSGIARAIAAQLRIRLSNTDSTRLAASLTHNPEAYEHYVVGRNHVAREEPEAAIRELTTAVTIDPDFAAAHAQLSLAHTWYAFYVPAQRPTHVPLALTAAQRALEIDPTLPEGHLALGVYYYRGDRDIDRAASELQQAVEGLPNDAYAHITFGFLRRWQGRWDEAAALFVRAADLDPLGLGARSALVTLAVMGRRDEALRVAAKARRSQPDAGLYAIYPARLAGDFDCDLGRVQALLAAVPSALAGDPDVVAERWYDALRRGDSKAALEVLDLVPPSRRDESYDWRRALALRAAGRSAEARKLLQAQIMMWRDELGHMPTDADRASRLSWLAFGNALLGERHQAVELAERAIALVPAQSAAMERSDVYQSTLVALTQAGDRAAALKLLPTLLATPSPVKPSGYWCDPMLAPLRRDPTFRQLMGAAGANVSIDPMNPATWPR